MFFLLYTHNNDGVIDDFPKISDHFPRISEDSPNERCRKFSENFRRLPKFVEDCRRLPKTFEEDPKIFRSYANEFKYNLTDKLDISENIDILTSEDMENTPFIPPGLNGATTSGTPGCGCVEFYERCIFQ